MPVTQVQCCRCAIHCVVEQFAGDVEVLVEAGRDGGGQLLLDVGRHLGQQVLPPGGRVGDMDVVVDSQVVQHGQKVLTAQGLQRGGSF